MTEYTNTPILPEKAKELMSLDTEYKEIITYGKIEEWFTAWDGKVYVSFSGGKDSTVLAYLAANWLSHFRTPPWPLNLVFINTGLEYPEIQRFVNENRFERMKHTHPKHYEFCIGGGEWDTDGLWKPNEKGLGYGRVLDYIGVRY